MDNAIRKMEEIAQRCHQMGANDKEISEMKNAITTKLRMGTYTPA